MRKYVVLLAVLVSMVFVSARGAAGQPLDLKRYMPLSELRPGMTGIGKTTLEGSAIVEFQVRVMAILKNVGPRRDLIIIRASGAGLEETGMVAGMSGSPVFIDGRLIGAVAYAFPWGKAPLGGVQPIEQMLAVSDEKPWTARQGPLAGQEGGMVASFPPMPPGAGLGPLIADLRGVSANQALPNPSIVPDPADQAFSVPVAALGLPDVPPALAGRQAFDLRPIQTPVMVSGMSGRAMERLREALVPLGLVPMMGGGADAKNAPAARLEPGAPLAVTLLRGDMQMASMGTITEIVGDRLYGFGHALFGEGEADFPLMTGIGHVVIPSLMSSFRMGAPVADVGRLTWDEQTAIFGRLSKDRAAMVPISVKVTGPSGGIVRTYRFEMIRSRRLSPMLAATAASNSLEAHAQLPRDHTIAYRVSVKPVGRPAVVRENLAVSPDGDMHLEGQVRTLVGMTLENPFRNLDVESVDVEATIEPISRMAEIHEVRLLRNVVRPGGTVPIDMNIRPWRAEPKWTRVEVQVPADYPEGTYRLRLCGADDSLRQEMREAPARFQPDDIDGLLALLGRNERRDQLVVRLDVPGDGLAIGRDELPRLPPAMRSVLTDSARRQVSGVRQPRITRQPTPYVLQGSGEVEVTVNRHAPEP
jgi:hypothetical protein